MKRMTAIILALTMSFSFTCSASAMDMNTSTDGYAEITYEQLPDEFKAIVNDDAKIYVDSEGNYSVYQSSSGITTRAIERNAPDGGTYTDLNNPYINNVLLVISWSYVPAEVVLDWAVGSTNGAISSILAWAVAGYAADKIVTLVAATYGLSVPAWWIAALVTAGQLVDYTLFQMNKNAALEALSECDYNGVIVKYVMSTTNYNFVRIFEPWNNYPYALLYPNGGTASWAAGEYDACFNN